MSGGPLASSGQEVSDMLRWNHMFTAQILDSAGNPMRLYGVDRSLRRVEAYVEAEVGEKFSVKIDCLFLHRETHVAYLYLGQQYITGAICKPDLWPVDLKERQISENEAQTLMFSKPAMTDDETNSIRKPEDVAKLGVVSVQLRRVDSQQPMKDSFPDASIGPQQAVYERAKKVGAIQFSAGPKIQRPSPGKAQCIIDPSFPPVFLDFHCTTRLGLQLLGHIPMDGADISSRSKKRSREEEEKNEAEKIEAEERRLRNELEILEQRRRSLGNASGSGSAGMRTKTSRSSVPVKKEKRKFDFTHGGT
ncbi:unnamed protein product, partial [Tilletia controversa]